jgi:hypothetical protein
MTEAEWLKCTQTMPMLEYLENKVRDRKLMLFSVACLRRIWHLLTDERSRKLVEATEQFVDNPGSEQVRRRYNAAYDAFYKAYQNEEIGSEEIRYVAHSGTMAAVSVAHSASDAVGSDAAKSIHTPTPGEWPKAKTIAWRSAANAESVAQIALLRDIVGNPFRPIAVKPSWRTPQVVKLARIIYDKRAFKRMPELVDPLKEAGCTNVTVFRHCRKSNSHVRGCWLLDLLLGKEEGMTEAEWLACIDIQLMWWFLWPRPSKRKERLFAVACCRRIWHLLTHRQSRQAVRVAERFADGQATHSEWMAAYHAAYPIGFSIWTYEAHDSAAAAAATAGCDYGPSTPAEYAAEACGRTDEPAVQASLLRDMVGNPSRPVRTNPSWLTPKVVKLAQAIYDKRAFKQMPKLARALEDAGCSNQDVLDHCRGPGPHARGCWVVDLILGKE